MKVNLPQRAKREAKQVLVNVLPRAKREVKAVLVNRQVRTKRSKKSTSTCHLERSEWQKEVRGWEVLVDLKAWSERELEGVFVYLQRFLLLLASLRQVGWQRHVWPKIKNIFFVRKHQKYSELHDGVFRSSMRCLILQVF